MSKNEKSEVVEDFLDADPPIRGQNFCLMSFCDPPKNIVQEKELFILKEFLNKINEQWFDAILRRSDIHSQTTKMQKAIVNTRTTKIDFNLFPSPQV